MKDIRTGDGPFSFMIKHLSDAHNSQHRMRSEYEINIFWGFPGVGYIQTYLGHRLASAQLFQ